MAGEGFYRIACELKPEYKDWTEADAWRNENKLVRECKDWDRLKAYALGETIKVTPKTTVQKIDDPFAVWLNKSTKLAESSVDKYARAVRTITGAVSPQRRQEIVDEFAKAENGAVLVSQVQADGTGLNIQSASVIIFCEPQIKPSIESQAISRAYRMGQVRDVLVYRLLADDTIDEQIMELLKNKQLQFDSFADESVVGEESLKPGEAAWISTMVEEEKKRLLEAPEKKN